MYQEPYSFNPVILNFSQQITESFSLNNARLRRDFHTYKVGKLGTKFPKRELGSNVLKFEPIPKRGGEGRGN